MAREYPQLSQPSPGFNLAGARNAGYSDSEIADYLSQQSSFDIGAARKAGYSDNEITGFLSAPPPSAPAKEDQSSTIGATVRGAERGAAPAAGGFAGMVGGAELGAMAGAAIPVLGETGIGELGGAVVGGLAGAFGGSAAVQSVQNAILDMVPESVRAAIGQSKTQQEADELAHPYASMIGELAPNLALMRPGAAVKLAESGGSALARALASPVGSRAVGAGLMGAQEAATEEIQTGTIDPTKVAIAAGSGALMNRETKLGEGIRGRIEGAIPRIGPVPTSASPEAVAEAVTAAPSVDAAIATAKSVAEAPASVGAATADVRAAGEAAIKAREPIAWEPIYSDADVEIGQHNPKTGEIRWADNSPGGIAQATETVKDSVSQATLNGATPPIIPSGRAENVQPVSVSPGAGEGLVLPNMSSIVPEELAQRGSKAPEIQGAAYPGVGTPEIATGSTTATGQPVTPIMAAEIPGSADVIHSQEPAPQFDPLAYLNQARAIVRDKRIPITPDALAKRLDIAPDEASRVIATLVSSPDSGVILDAKGNPRRIAQRSGPPDVASFLADRGGIRDDEGHDLKGSGLQQLVPGAGPLVRSTGMSIDEAGEKLSEAGFFGPAKAGAERPSEADVLDLISQTAGRNKVYLPEDQAGAAETATARRDAETQAAAVTDIHDVAKAYGIEPTQDHVDAVLERMGPRGISAEDATVDYLERLAIQADSEHSTETGNAALDIATPKPAIVVSRQGAADRANGKPVTGSAIEPSATVEGGDVGEATAPRATAIEEAQGVIQDAEDYVPFQRRKADEAPSMFATEPGAEDARGNALPQTIIPGAERASERTMLERQAQAPLRGEPGQKATTGLGLFDKNAPLEKGGKPEEDQGALFARRGEEPSYPLASKDEWYGNANFENTGGKLQWMTPDEYLAKVRSLKIDETSRDNIDDLKLHMGSGKPLDPLSITADGKEDGRHRAVAAKELGIRKVPVITWEKPEDATLFKRGDGKAHPSDATTQSFGRGTTGGFSPEFHAEREAVATDLQKRLSKIGPKGTALKVPDWIKTVANGKASAVDALYLRKLIAVALDTKDKIGAVNHEVVHALREAGSFNSTEWNILRSKAENEWIAKHRIEKRYGNITREQTVEEAIAHEFSDWANAKEKPRTTIGRIFQNMWDTVRSIGDTLRGAKFNTPEDIFGAVDRGTIARRGVAEAGREEPQFQTRDDKPETRAYWNAQTGKVEYRTYTPKPAVETSPEVEKNPRALSLQPIEGEGEWAGRGVNNAAYKVGTEAPQKEAADKMVAKDYDRAVSIALRQEQPPKNVHPEFYYMAVERKATRDGDTATLLKLHNSKIAEEATIMGQRNAAWRNRDELSPVIAMESLEAARTATLKARGVADPVKAKNALTDEYVAGVQATKKAVSRASKRETIQEFIASIRCK